MNLSWPLPTNYKPRGMRNPPLIRVHYSMTMEYVHPSEDQWISPVIWTSQGSSFSHPISLLISGSAPQLGPCKTPGNLWTNFCYLLDNSNRDHVGTNLGFLILPHNFSWYWPRNLSEGLTLNVCTACMLSSIITVKFQFMELSLWRQCGAMGCPLDWDKKKPNKPEKELCIGPLLALWYNQHSLWFCFPSPYGDSLKDPMG